MHQRPARLAVSVSGMRRLLFCARLWLRRLSADVAVDTDDADDAYSYDKLDCVPAGNDVTVMHANDSI